MFKPLNKMSPMERARTNLRCAERIRDAVIKNCPEEVERFERYVEAQRAELARLERETV